MGLEQMCSTAEELLAVLVGDTPQDIILNIHEMSRQITALRRKHEEQLKSDIKYLTSLVNQTDDVKASTLNNDDTLENLAQKETAMLKQIDNLQKQLMGLTGEHQHLKEELAKAKSEQQSLKMQHQRIKEAQAAALPKARCDLNLYSNITNIKWQYQCEPHEIKGYISNNNDIKTFSFNTQQVSRFFIANYLWDLIEEDW